MARRQLELQPLPSHYSRTLCEGELSPLFFRRIAQETEGRGNGWQMGTLHGWDHDCDAGDAAIVYAKDCGGWRTLSPEVWEWK